MIDASTAFDTDMRRVRALDRHMVRLGDRFHRSRNAAERDRIESDQERVNERLHLILRRYTVHYERGFFTVSDAAGNQARFDGED